MCINFLHRFKQVSFIHQTSQRIDSSPSLYATKLFVIFRRVARVYSRVLTSHVANRSQADKDHTNQSALLISVFALLVIIKYASSSVFQVIHDSAPSQLVLFYISVLTNAPNDV